MSDIFRVHFKWVYTNSQKSAVMCFIICFRYMNYYSFSRHLMHCLAWLIYYWYYYLYTCLICFVGFYNQKASFDFIFYALMYLSGSTISVWWSIFIFKDLVGSFQRLPIRKLYLVTHQYTLTYDLRRT